MKKIVFIFSFILSLNCAKAQFNDTFKNELSISNNKRKFVGFYNYYGAKGPFLANSILSTNIQYGLKIKTYKRCRILFLSGLTIKHHTIGYNAITNRISNVKEDIRVRNFQIGINAGLSLDKRIYRNKNNIFYLCGGGFLYKSVYTPLFSKYYLYDNIWSTNKDSVAISFERNTKPHPYPYPFIQFKGKSKIKDKTLIYGIKLNVGNDLAARTFINFTLGQYYDGDYYRFTGSFRDARNQWEFYLGLAF